MFSMYSSYLISEINVISSLHDLFTTACVSFFMVREAKSLMGVKIMGYLSAVSLMLDVGGIR